MLHHRRIAGLTADGNSVKAVEVAGSTMSGDPGAGDSFDLAALGAGDRLEGVAVGVTGSRLDFDEGDGAAATDDEVDLAVAQSEVTLEHGPALCLERARGDLLAAAPELMRPAHGPTIEVTSRGYAIAVWDSGEASERPMAWEMALICLTSSSN